ncbi:MAG: magnesium transporter [Fimbriimonadaceae bacterium]|nr:magnesium transporter [Fimbriimonadaceae bacterium]
METTTTLDLAARLQAALATGAPLDDALGTARAVDVAEALGTLSDSESLAVFAALDNDRAVDLFDDLSPSLVEFLVENTPRERLVALLDAMPVDEAADVLANSDADVAAELLALLEHRAPSDAKAVRGLLAHPEGTAGRLMTDNFVRLRPWQSVQAATASVRLQGREAETLTDLYVVGNGGSVLLGVLSMRDLVLADSTEAVRDLMTTDLVTVATDTDAQEVARLVAKYDLFAIPVLDKDGRFVGIVTVDDVIDVMVEGFTDDIAKMVGTDAEEMDRRSPAQVARMRLPWLLGTMAIELFAGAVISRFDAVLTKVILLASFMPVISAISGNVGLQAAAIVVRGLDTGHVKIRDTRRAVRKEFWTTLLMAGACGILLGAVGAVWSRHPFFGVVIGTAMFASMLTAGFMGTVIPIVSKRLGFDPAATAGPFETAFQDVIGFAVLLWVASLLLPWLT